MASMFVIILLAIATTCRGAALSGQTRMKRKATVWDKSFDFLGLHAGLKYKDATQPLKGVTFFLTVDDLKKIFPQSHSNKMEVDADFDGGVAMDDGLFRIVFHYSIMCADGNGEERGGVVIERKHTGDLWTTLITTSSNAFSGEPVIPAAISNLEIMIESDRQTKLHVKYVNPTKNRDMHIIIDRVPGESLKIGIANGDRTHDLTFKVVDLNFQKMDGIFNITVEGTSLGDPVKGKVSGSKKGDMQVFQFDLERGNKKIIQFETKLKMIASGLCFGICGFEIRTKYAVLGGTITGKVLLKLEKGIFSFKNTDSSSNESLELTVKFIPGGSLEIEGKKNEETMWTGEFEYYINKINKNLLLNKFYAKGTVMKDGNKALNLLLTTNETPYKFELFAPALLDKVNPGMTEAKISVEHHLGQSLELQTNFEKFTSLKIYKTGSGNERKVELNGKELIMGDYTLTDNSFSTKITLGNDYLEPKITWEGKLPQTKEEAEAFMLKNNILFIVTGTIRNLDLSLNWKMNVPAISQTAIWYLYL